MPAKTSKTKEEKIQEAKDAREKRAQELREKPEKALEDVIELAELKGFETGNERREEIALAQLRVSKRILDLLLAIEKKLT